MTYCPYTPEELEQLIRPLPRAKYEVSVGFNHIERTLAMFEKDYGLELEPDFQRGHVWTTEQRECWLEAVLRSNITQSGLTIQFNHPSWDEIADPAANTDMPNCLECVDGLQRLTTVRLFMTGQLRAFGLTVDQFRDTPYDLKRSIFRLNFAVHAFKSREAILTYYLDINTNGTIHTQEEIERVRGLLRLAQERQRPTERP